MSIRKIRRSQTVSPFGVGSIYDFGEESFVPQDIGVWKGGEKIYLKRLSDKLGIQYFKMGPVPKNQFSNFTPKIPFVRFPAWLFCAKCRKMVRAKPDDERPGELPVCRGCNSQLTPMRFVLVCENGHMDDVDWRYWAHSTAKKPAQKQCKDYNNLTFRSRAGMGGGLESVEVKCETCKASRNLHQIASKDAMKSVGIKCPGRQPWQSMQKAEDCGCVPQVVQRGASNVYYPVTVSALDISSSEATEEVADKEQSIRNHGFFSALVGMAGTQTNPLEDKAVARLAKCIAEQVGCSEDEVYTVAEIGTGEKEKTEEDAASADKSFKPEDLFREEWLAFLNPPDFSSPDDHFVAESLSMRSYEDSLDGSSETQIAHGALSGLLDRIVLARRLREVRSLRGFDRYNPKEKDHLRPDLGKGCDWLPAVEVFGEGIFLSLNETELKKWEKKYRAGLANRLLPIVEGKEKSGITFLPEASARFVLQHTLAHLLIRQLSFECGYSASSLRERIYCASPRDPKGPMAGILIYTADSDSEGSLGGLVKQGEPKLLLPTLYRSLHQALWCSGDPVCGEVRNQGLYGMNRGACHSCAIVSETSCTSMNVLLDRKVLIDEAPNSVGFFNPLLKVFSEAFSE